MASPGRNDPCPCGSGRRFKHCCLRAQDEEDGQRLRLRSAEGVLVPALFSYALEEFGEEFFEEAWDEFFLWNAPDNVDGSKEFGTTFDPFLVFGFVPDFAEDELPVGWPIEPVALHFLHHAVESIPAFHHEFVEQACKSPASFCVVEAVAPGRSIDIKDILTGQRFHVLEQSASQTLKGGANRTRHRTVLRNPSVKAVAKVAGGLRTTLWGLFDTRQLFPDNCRCSHSGSALY